MALLKQNFPQQATGAAVSLLEKEIDTKLAQLQQRKMKEEQSEPKEPDEECLDDSGGSVSLSVQENIGITNRDTAVTAIQLQILRRQTFLESE